MEANKKVIDDYTQVVNKLIVDEIKKNNKKIVPVIVEKMILDDKDLFKDHVKHIAKSIIEESPHIRYGQAVFNYVDEKYVYYISEKYFPGMRKLLSDIDNPYTNNRIEQLKQERKKF